jgi:acetyltransferase-like isoleucine patch superfamily enzyme
MIVSLFSRGLYSLLNLPTKIRERLYCARIRRLCSVDETVEISPSARIFNPIGKDSVSIGSNTLCMGEMQVIGPSGQIRVGQWCYIGPESRLWAKGMIEIGDRVFISHGVHIFDNNSHSLSAAERHQRFYELRTTGGHQTPEVICHRPVTLEDDVWIGFNSAVLKGVTIGRGAVVGACSVVTHDVPPYAVVVGNPARPVGESRP